MLLLYYYRDSELRIQFFSCRARSSCNEQCKNHGTCSRVTDIIMVFSNSIQLELHFFHDRFLKLFLVVFSLQVIPTSYSIDIFKRAKGHAHDPDVFSHGAHSHPCHPCTAAIGRTKATPGRRRETRSWRRWRRWRLLVQMCCGRE